MRSYLKYLLWCISFITLIIFFFTGTQLGNKALGSFLTMYLSNKTHNTLEVEYLNIDNYPKMVMEICVNKGAKVHLEGFMSRGNIDMKYHLEGEEYRWNSYLVEGIIDLNGTMKGKLSSLEVEGEGTVFEGSTKYKFTKTVKQYRDMKVKLSEVQSQDLLKFLHLQPLIEGRANIESEFKLFSMVEKEGQSIISMHRGLMPTVAPNVPFELNSTIDFKDISYLFNGEIQSKIGMLEVKNAHYHKSKKEASGTYILKLKDLAYFEKFLKHRYSGGLNAEGKFSYKEGQYLVAGTSDKFGGHLAYRYENGSLNLKLKGLSLVEMVKQFNYPAIFSAKVYGDIDYNMKDKIVMIDTKLKEVRFRETKMTNMIHRATRIDMIRDVYDDSSFVAGYQNERLNAVLKIDNGHNHLYLTETVLNAKSNSIDSKFELKMQGQELEGSIYGTLQHPKVNVNMKRLLKYQMKKGFGYFFH